ncbi:hypothetical protein ACTRW9_02745 [Nitrospina sp. 32_T5]|uniref:hypothetical protein n=1 Tax=unclassified Nitrospina TaxID=2638683 RepID=UPI003F9C1C9A
MVAEGLMENEIEGAVSRPQPDEDVFIPAPPPAGCTATGNDLNTPSFYMYSTETIPVFYL